MMNPLNKLPCFFSVTPANTQDEVFATSHTANTQATLRVFEIQIC